MKEGQSSIGKPTFSDVATQPDVYDLVGNWAISSKTSFHWNGEVRSRGSWKAPMCAS